MGAVVGILAALEVPVILAITAVYRWVRSVNERLEAIESRSRRVRWYDADRDIPIPLERED